MTPRLRESLTALVLLSGGLGGSLWWHSREIRPESTATTASSGRIDFSLADGTRFDLGRLPLGSITELTFTVEQMKPGRPGAVESSCSCLQPLGWEDGSSPGIPAIRARYFAVRPGPIDVQLAVNAPEGNGPPATVRVTGEVLPGDPAMAANLSELVRLPRFDFGSLEQGIATTASDAMESVRSGRAIVIDVRSAEDFAESHVNGSLNIPVAQLTASPAFRGRDLILTGPVLVTGPLQQACLRLRTQTKARVTVVPGGVPAWQLAGADVFHLIDPAPAIGRVALPEIAERLHGQQVVHAGIRVDDFAFRYLFPDGERIPLPTGAGAPPDDATAVRQWIEARLASAPATIVIVDGAGDRFALFNEQAPANWRGRVHYLRTSFPDYQEAAARLATLAAAVPGEGRSSVNGYARRDGLRRTNLPSAPGCGSCPK
jgi:rhodanese-related sulfurtransferase